MGAITEETLLRYCQTVYDAMDNEAEDGVWKGAVTRLYGGLGLSNANYSRVMDALLELGAVERLQRGARSSPSIFRLHDRPETLDGLVGIPRSDLTRASAYATLDGRLTALERRLEGIEVKRLFKNLHDRVVKLEQESDEVDASHT